MAQFSLSPAVTVTETDLRTVIPAVSTSTAGFAGSFEWGPGEDVTLVTSENELVSYFGKPRVATSESTYQNRVDWYAASNFLSYSDSMRLVRAINEDHRNASDFKKIVGRWRSSATFQPATFSTTQFSVQFSGTVSGTAADGATEQFSVQIGGTANGAYVAGTRQVAEATFANWGGTFTQAAVPQVEQVNVSGTATAAGNILVSYGSNVVSVPVAVGDTGSDIAGAMESALGSTLFTFTRNGGALTLTRNGEAATLGSSVQYGTGIMVADGRVRRIAVDVSGVAGITATVSVTTPGRAANTRSYLVGSDDLGSSYLLVESAEDNAAANTLNRLAQKLAAALRSLSYIQSATVTGDTVRWTHTEESATPTGYANGAYTFVTGINNANEIDLTATLVTTGVNPVARVDQTIAATDTTDGTAVNVPITGGTSAAGATQEILTFANTEGFPYTANTNWVVTLASGSTNVLTFTAPTVGTNVATGRRPFGTGAEDGLTFTVSDLRDGALPGSSTIGILGQNIPVQEGETAAQVALEFIDVVRSLTGAATTDAGSVNNSATRVFASSDVYGIDTPTTTTTSTLYGITFTVGPLISTEAQWNVQDPTLLVAADSTFEFTPYLANQVAINDRLTFSYTNEDNEVITKTGTVVEIVTNVSPAQIRLSDIDNGAIIGRAQLDGDEVSAPADPVGAVGYVAETQLFANDNVFTSTTLNSGHVYAAYPGTFGNNIGVAIVDSCESLADYRGAVFGQGNNQLYRQFSKRPGDSDLATATSTGYNDQIHVLVFDATGEITGTVDTVLEKFEFLSKNREGKNGDNVNNYWVTYVNANSDYIRLSEGFLGSGDVAMQDMDTAGYIEWGSAPLAGSGERFRNLNRAYVTTIQGGVDADPTDGDLIRAYNLLSDADTVDLSLLLTANHTNNVKDSVIDLATDDRKDCVAFVSPSYDAAVVAANSETVVDYFDRFRSTSYAVFDSGWKYQYDRYNNDYFWSPLSSDVAGLCARTDDSNDAWWSPAGVKRGQIKNVVRLSYNPTKAQRDELYVNRVNPIVTLLGQGTVLYGDKTALSNPSSFDRINVRRLFITLEKAIATSARNLLVEFNDSFTRQNFVNSITPYLRDVQSRRGIFEYYVVADESNNTGEIIDQNAFVGDIYIKPAKSINFIQLNFIAVPTGVAFSEIIRTND